MAIHIKRIYEPPASTDGFRVLIDRLWPRGVSKQDAALDFWLKEVAPTAELRNWFDHIPERFDEFTTRYRAELDNNPALDQLREVIASEKTVTLLYGAKNETMNQAVVLQQYLK
jgi:DNA-3-methyladenine glycosylase